MYKPTFTNPDDSGRRLLKDEATPEALMERRKSMSELSAYYNTQNRDEQKKAASTASGGLKLQDNVKTILGVKD